MKNEHGPLGKAWTDIGSDCDWIGCGGRWARHIKGTRYHVIRFDNMIEACGRDADPSQPYACDLHEVDIASEQLQAACDCVGADADTIEGDIGPLTMVEALSSYGAYAPLWQDGGRNAHALIRAARAKSRELSSNHEAYEAAMDRPVNKIGSTAREYAAGDFSSAVLRGLAEGRTDAMIMAKMGMLKR